jgi:hypothetical protein
LRRHQGDALRSVAIETSDESGHDTDSSIVQLANSCLVSADLVLRLVCVSQGLGAERFDSKKDPDAA